MKQIYNMAAYRHISSANHNVYIHGVLHPDRVMSEHDFVYISQGYWEIYQNTTAYKLYPDDVILLHTGAHHYGLTPCDPNTKTMYIHVNCDNLDEFGNVFESDMGSLTVLNTVIHCQNNPKVKAVFQDIISAYLSETLHRETKISALFCLLLCELQECLVGEDTDKLSIADEIVQVIVQNPQRFFTAKELSGRFFICERTLMKRFKQKYGKTIYCYQMDTKMKAIRFFLQDHPDIKLHEVALNFGFYDEFHLSKTFKKQFGISPKQYRSSTAEIKKGIDMAPAPL